jgi:hypothetical protein
MQSRIALLRSSHLHSGEVGKGASQSTGVPAWPIIALSYRLNGYFVVSSFFSSFFSTFKGEAYFHSFQF